MAMILCRDGKERALKASMGESLASLGPLYVGLMSSVPSGSSEDLILSDMSSYEMTINSNFYTARKEAEFTYSYSSYSAGMLIKDDPSVEWTNTSGSSITIAGVFITNAASGSSGKLLWIGVPDKGSAVITNGNKALFEEGQLEVRIR